jgi:hypothetical protein
MRYSCFFRSFFDYPERYLTNHSNFPYLPANAGPPSFGSQFDLSETFQSVAPEAYDALAKFTNLALVAWGYPPVLIVKMNFTALKNDEIY